MNEKIFFLFFFFLEEDGGRRWDLDGWEGEKRVCANIKEGRGGELLKLR